METFSALLAICAGNSPVPVEFPPQRPVTRSFDVFYDLCPNKQLSKRWWGWWFGTQSCPLWRHSNVIDTFNRHYALKKLSFTVFHYMRWINVYVKFSINYLRVQLFSRTIYSSLRIEMAETAQIVPCGYQGALYLSYHWCQPSLTTFSHDIYLVCVSLIW